MTKIKFEIPEFVSRVTNTLQENNFEAYVVGGCVRDLFLGKTPSDWDITTSANPEEIQKIFPHTFYENDYGTVGVVNDEIVEEIDNLREEFNKEEEKFQKLLTYEEKNVSRETLEKINEKIVSRETLKVVEVTPYRLEGNYSDNRKPDEVKFSKNLEDDLKRRDFTINAICYNPKTGEIIDLFGGINDLQDKTIKTINVSRETLTKKTKKVDVSRETLVKNSKKSDVSRETSEDLSHNNVSRETISQDFNVSRETFEEDALRMLRAVRFSGQLGFNVSRETSEAIVSCETLLKNISKERVRDEFVKILMSENPLQTLFLAKDLNVLKYISPDLERGVGCDQNGAHIFDVFEHLLRTMQHGADKKWSLEIRLAGLFHDISKPETRRWNKEKNDWTFYGHEVVGASVTKKALEDLKFSRETIDLVTTLVRWHMFFSDPDKITLSAVRRIIRNVGPENVWNLIKLRICDRIGMGRPKEKTYRLRQYEAMMEEAMRSPISVKDLKINGSQIMTEFKIKPGKKIGYILNALMNITLNDPEKNNYEYLLEKVKEYILKDEADLKKMAEEGKEKIEESENQELKEIKKKHKIK